MPFIASTTEDHEEYRLVWPTILHAKVARSRPSKCREAALDALDRAKIIFEQAIVMKARINELEYENRRLLSENEFLLRQINDQ